MNSMDQLLDAIVADDLLKVLLAAGASPDLEDGSGKSVRQCVQSDWTQSMIEAADSWPSGEMDGSGPDDAGASTA